ncbi:MAG: hypothetical protein M3N08_07020 [Pseudomonadota bacterium]|nr:hypothetical protein [Pseudomonadota bacterium]
MNETLAQYRAAAAMRPQAPLPTPLPTQLSSPSTLAINKSFFVSPPGAGRKITAGFSWMQRIGKSASMDVWFPEILRRELEAFIREGGVPNASHFPGQWAAVRQFELLQEAGNYKIYDMDAEYMTRTLVDLSRNMRAGGYRVTVATIGSYDDDHTAGDELEILDQRLQDRIARLTHMLYLEEQSAAVNKAIDRVIADERWDYQTALPHVGLTVNARNLFASLTSKTTPSEAGRKHKLIGHFFDILSLLPQKHIIHDTAIGLQLPESIAEHEWIYLAEGEMTLRAFNVLLGDLFRPFDKVSMAGIDGRADASAEVKSTVQHMRGYGDRLTDDSDKFYRDAARYALQ